MKKVFLAALLVVGMTTIAQEKKAERPEKERMSSEQQVALRVKKMKLDLDLNDKQVVEVKKLVIEQVQKREVKRAEFEAKKAAERKRNMDEKFELKTKMLDEQTAQKAEMKKILNPEQFAKWENIQSERDEKKRDRMDRRMHNR
jgi:protein CpxP